MSDYSVITEPDQESNPKLRRMLLKIIGRVLLGIVALILLLILTAVLVTSIDNYRGHKAVAKRYNAAVERCGAEPIVIIKEVDFYRIERTHAYAPVHPEYLSKTKFYSNVSLTDSEEWVEEYLCTLQEAEQKYGDNLERDPYNYPNSQP